MNARTADHSTLRHRVEAARRDKDLLLMTHIVIGYPSFDASMRMIEAMVENGVDLMELQIPFSEPIADGPVILRANQTALDNGSSVDQCFDFAERVTQRFDIPFLFMSYYNVPFRMGTETFMQRTREAGLLGAIIPDLPPEEAAECLQHMALNDIAPVFIFSPNTPVERMRMLADQGRGFVYCVARKGVTGATTQFSEDLGAYLGRCRNATDMPLALGFGVQDRADIDFLRGRVDIAVVGTQSIRVFDEQGAEGVGRFIAELTAPAESAA